MRRPHLVLTLVAVVALLGSTPFAPSATAASLGPISEETPPAICDPGSFVSEIRCTDSYCDDIRITCQALPGASLGRAVWTPWVSEEQGRRDCPRSHLIAGLACRGSYCDNLSLLCVEVTNLRAVNCSNTGRVSEENGGRLNFFAAGGGDVAGLRILARAMTCSGRYCDNKSFQVCEASVQR